MNNDKITDFYNFWRDCMTKYYEAVGINFTEFTNKYNINVINTECFLWSLVKQGIDLRETYEEDLRSYNEHRQEYRTNRVDDDWSKEEQDSKNDRYREDFYWDDLKDFGNLQTALLSHYKKDIDNPFDHVDDIVSSLKLDERFV